MSSVTKVKPKPDDVDVQVGKNLRAFRRLTGMSQEELSTKVGITFQQIQKYESGTNRISASRMYKLATVLKINVTDFYRGLEDNGEKDMLSLDKETLELISVYQQVTDEKLRKSILSVLKKLAKR